MRTQVDLALKSIDVRGENDDGYLLTVNFIVHSSLGQFNLAVPLEGVPSIDRAVPEAKGIVARWGHALATVAQKG